ASACCRGSSSRIILRAGVAGHGVVGNEIEIGRRLLVGGGRRRGPLAGGAAHRLERRAGEGGERGLHQRVHRRLGLGLRGGGGGLLRQRRLAALGGEGDPPRPAGPARQQVDQ